VQADFVDERLYEYPESDRGSVVTGYNVLVGFGQKEMKNSIGYGGSVLDRTFEMQNMDQSQDGYNLDDRKVNKVISSTDQNTIRKVKARRENCNSFFGDQINPYKHDLTITEAEPGFLNSEDTGRKTTLMRKSQDTYEMLPKFSEEEEFDHLE
jgi:hypothetical protein